SSASIFIRQSCDHHLVLHSFPTRRSSDLHETPWQLLFATILSAQCTDERVNQVTSRLFVKYPTLEAFANADVSEMERDIFSTGRSEEHTSELQSRFDLVCRLLLEKTKCRI